MAQYTTIHPVRHNGERTPSGQPIDLPEKAAKQLLAAGVIMPASQAPSAASDDAAAKVVAIGQATSLEAVEELVAGDKRVSVQEAGQARMIDLGGGTKVNADVLVKRIAEANTADEVARLAGEDTRATVTKARDKRLEQLQPAAE